MQKYFYFANRKPGFTSEAFAARWRQHGALAMSRPFWSRKMLAYVHADAVRPSPIPGISVDYDGFCYGIFDPAGLSIVPSPEDEAITQQLPGDELETFSGPIPPRLMFVEPAVLLPGGTGVAAVLAFSDLGRAQSVGATFAEKAGLERVVVNVIQRDAALEAPFANFAAIVEVGASSEARLKAAFEAVPANSWRNAELALVAQEVPLWDRRGG